jgi:hypothetical protein
MAFAPSQTTPTFKVGDRVTWRDLARVGKVAALDTATFPGETWAKVEGAWASPYQPHLWLPVAQLRHAT